MLNEIHAAAQARRVQYWRDKSQHEVDFIWAPRGGRPMAIECKWRAGDFDASGIQAFRRRYPDGDNVVVADDVERTFQRTCGGIAVRFMSLPSLVGRIAAA